MLKMEEIQEIIRLKKSFKLDYDEFLRGDWLKELAKIFNHDKMDLEYKNGILYTRFMKKEKK